MSADFDLHNSVLSVIAIDNADNPAATASGNIIDTNGAYSLEFFINSGGLALAGTVDFVMEYGDDAGLSDAAPVPTDFIVGTLADVQLTSTSPETKRVGYVGKKRYVRIGYTSSQSGIFGALGVKHMFRHEASPSN